MPVAWHDRRVLVTGGTGFIGRSLLVRLARAGARLRVSRYSARRRLDGLDGVPVEWLDGDLRDPAFCHRLVDGVDHVFHLACRCHNVEVHQERCGDILTANLAMTVALAEALQARAPVPVVVFSTANVPPDGDVAALARPPVVDGYLLGKALGDLVWLTTARQRAYPLLIVRPVGVYGPHDTFAADGHVIPALMVKARTSADALQVWGDGSQERAFVYVEDLSAAVLTLADAGAEGIAYVSPPATCSVRHLAETIRDLVRPGLRLEFDQQRARGSARIAAPLVHPLLRTFPWTPLAEGLQRTYAAWSAAIAREPAGR